MKEPFDPPTIYNLLHVYRIIQNNEMTTGVKERNFVVQRKKFKSCLPGEIPQREIVSFHLKLYWSPSSYLRRLFLLVQTQPEVTFIEGAY